MKRILSLACLITVTVGFGQKNARVQPSSLLAPHANTLTQKPEVNTKTLGVVLWLYVIS